RLVRSFLGCHGRRLQEETHTISGAVLQISSPKNKKAWLQAAPSRKKSDPHSLDAGAENCLHTHILSRPASPNSCGHELPAVSACLAQGLYRMLLRRPDVHNNHGCGFLGLLLEAQQRFMQERPIIKARHYNSEAFCGTRRYGAVRWRSGQKSAGPGHIHWYMPRALGPLVHELAPVIQVMLHNLRVVT